MKRLVLNAQNKLSWTKIGIWIVSVTTALLSSSVMPESFDVWLKVIIALGTAIGSIGVRDALDQKNK